MNDRRLLLAVALAGVILIGWQFFMKSSGLEQRLEPPPPAATATAPAPGASGTGTSGSGATPPPAAAPGDAALASIASAPSLVNAPAESLTVLDTPHWHIVFSSHGAQPIHWTLKEFKRGDRGIVELIPAEGALEQLYVRARGRALNFAAAAFTVAEDRQEGDAHVLAYEARDSSGVQLKVRYRIPASGYVPQVSYSVTGAGPEARVGVAWRSWKFHTETNEAEDIRQARVASLLGEKLEQDHVDAFRKTPEKTRASGSLHWSVVRSKYFAVGFLFGDDGPGEVTAYGNRDSLQVGTRFEVPLMGRESAGYDMYVGPVEFWKLQSAGHGLEHLVDSGFKIMVPLNRLMLKFFTTAHKVVPNYGLVIILLSVLMRLVFWPLNHAQMRSMKKMQDIQPEMERIRERYSKDPEKLNKEVLRLYKENNVNPMGGCLPILAQMPIFFALFNVLSGTIELRQAGFVGWITDLSAPDVLLTLGPALGGFPIHVLPLIMAGTMFWQQKLTPMDPRQAMTGYIMPFVMLFVFYNMPSGLVLYWTVTNILTALQQMQMRASKPEVVVT